MIYIINLLLILKMYRSFNNFFLEIQYYIFKKDFEYIIFILSFRIEN